MKKLISFARYFKKYLYALALCLIATGCSNNAELSVDKAVQKMAKLGKNKVCTITITDANPDLKLLKSGLQSTQAKIGLDFSKCTNLITIDEQAFTACLNVFEIKLPIGVTKIGNFAFAGCINLTKIEIPNTVKEIGKNAFNQCASLSEIILPEGIIKIGGDSFLGCKKLSEIRLPESLEEFTTGGENLGCDNLSKIYIPRKLSKTLTKEKILENFSDSTQLAIEYYGADNEIATSIKNEAEKEIKSSQVATKKFSVGTVSILLNRIPAKRGVSSFYLATTETTQSLYEAVMSGNPSYYRGEKLPVGNVSWFDCIVFCNKLSSLTGKTPVYLVDGTKDTTKWNYAEGKISGSVSVDKNADGFRLPTNAEWEIAFSYNEEYIVEQGAFWEGNKKFANGKLVKEYPTQKEGKIVIENNKIIEGKKVMNLIAVLPRGAGSVTPSQVGTKLPNKYGIFDMFGNMAEWVWDMKGNENFRYCRDTYGGRLYGLTDSTKDGLDVSREYPPSATSESRGFRVCTN